jgi:hypothetical protein
MLKKQKCLSLNYKNREQKGKICPVSGCIPVRGGGNKERS